MLVLRELGAGRWQFVWGVRGAVSLTRILFCRFAVKAEENKDEPALLALSDSIWEENPFGWQNKCGDDHSNLLVSHSLASRRQFWLALARTFLSVVSFILPGKWNPKYGQLVRTGALVTSESYNKWKSLSPLPPPPLPLCYLRQKMIFPPVCFGVFHPERKGLAYGYNSAFRAFWRAANVYLSRYKQVKVHS